MFPSNAPSKTFFFVLAISSVVIYIYAKNKDIQGRPVRLTPWTKKTSMFIWWSLLLWSLRISSEMDLYSHSRKIINDIINEFSFDEDRTILCRKVEDELLSLCLKFDNRIQCLVRTQSLNDRLISKDDETHKFMQKKLDLTKELSTTKKSAGCIIRFWRCL